MFFVSTDISNYKQEVYNIFYINKFVFLFSVSGSIPNIWISFIPTCKVMVVKLLLGEGGPGPSHYPRAPPTASGPPHRQPGQTDVGLGEQVDVDGVSVQADVLQVAADEVAVVAVAEGVLV